MSLNGLVASQNEQHALAKILVAEEISPTKYEYVGRKLTDSTRYLEAYQKLLIDKIAAWTDELQKQIKTF